ncbi:epidermal growth factor receptor substrate 15 [Galdieria sulphuraria]|uniref:Epidermal growth factor receptor substrate 15 n=1 Tax=Galdieria sulphuraria TaxID=130081 RepID=M2Y0A7_GALSU|nr:epidermal growth factor receptor substrate 15 [Galdieria sulphuraria]EME29269.1 epidermal growth factor receptor substrate 15 [Galdieria sulphuraria]|eukprot:XP_005705789.1 epidermal growth factor receptor substrate 15 [Galdieria sulphuraria]
MNPYYYQGGPGVGVPPQPYGAPPSYPPSQYGRGTSTTYGAGPYGMYQPPPVPSTNYAMNSPYGMYPLPQQQQQLYPMFPGSGAMRQQQAPPPNALPALTFEQSGNETKHGKEQGIRKYLQLSQQEQQQYAMLFREASKGSGTVLGRDAVQFFGRAVNVDRATLRKIWDIADYRSAGELRRDEFYIALRLLAIAQLGYEVSKKTLKQLIGKDLIPELKGYSNEPSHPPIPMNMYPASNLTHPPPQGGPASYPNQTMQQDFWELKPADCKKIDHQFAEMDKPKKGFLAGSKVAGKLAESGLPRPVLKRIWELADVTVDGKLDYIEFRIAMALVNGSKQGYPLPPSLPASLHPERLKKIPFARKTGKTSQSSMMPDMTSRTYNPSSSVIYASYGPGAAAWQENPSDLVRKTREADEELERTRLEWSQVEKEYQDLEEEIHHLRNQLDSKKWEMDYLRNTLQERQKGNKSKSSPSYVPPSTSPNVSHPSRQLSGMANHHGNSWSSDIFTAPTSSAPLTSTKTPDSSTTHWNDFSALPPPSNTTVLDNAYSSALNDTDDFLDRPYVPEGTWNQNSGGVYNVSRDNQSISNNMNDWAQYYPNSGGDIASSRSRGLSASKKHE